MPELAANLDLLRANAPAVWLAELGAWLHNAGKLHPIFLRKQAGILNNSPFDYRHVVVLLFPAAGTNVPIANPASTDDSPFSGCDVVVEHDIVNQRVACMPMEGRATR